MLFRLFGLLFNRRSRIPDDRDSKIVKPRLEDHPEGYPRIAAFINSDNDTVLFRRFGNLHSRLLLYKEVELTQLESQLAKLDRDDYSKDETRWRVHHSILGESGSQNAERKALVEKIEPQLLSYDNLLLHDEKMRRLCRPTERMHRTFMDYIYTENPFGGDEKDFIFQEEDFVTLQGHEESWLDLFLHRILLHCRKPILRHIFVSKKEQRKSADSHVQYYSDSRLGIAVKVIIALASTALLLIPVYMFVTLNTSPIKVQASITFFFAFIFATSLSGFTTAKRHEIFAATAGYCAVLVVFLGNLQQQNWSKTTQKASPT
ncbi:hypothetical protein HYFRA_00008345 [Hymenoscyphus fraxineus]|uniref:DUF6594 domain-containing protein n=1 Tax=Hymenoscyphus fraxineus TaxID=746836 RepID=A0A9N9KN43_9HELO|nr:hypothetical protein HYFRA_00008345 [Hymenoscyphus fraxineus]